MHFYRPLTALKALTFDLDDTLYDNRPVIQRTEQESLAYLQNKHPELREITSSELHLVRAELREQEPEIYHDVTEWRRCSLVLLLQRQGYSLQQAQQGADDAMDDFAHWRSKVEVPQETHQTLQALAERFPLVAITNGNADPHVFGLGHYFQFILRSGPDGRSKPFSDMYDNASRLLGLSPESILHVGDDLTTDVAGALRSGFQACWINDRDRSLMAVSDSRLLPHIEISRLASLQSLL